MPFQPYDPAPRSVRERGIPGTEKRRRGNTTRMLLRALVPASEHRVVVLVARTVAEAEIYRKELISMLGAIGLNFQQFRIRAWSHAVLANQRGYTGISWDPDEVVIFADHATGLSDEQARALVPSWVWRTP